MWARQKLDSESKTTFTTTVIPRPACQNTEGCDPRAYGSQCPPDVSSFSAEIRGAPLMDNIAFVGSPAMSLSFSLCCSPRFRSPDMKNETRTSTHIRTYRLTNLLFGLGEHFPEPLGTWPILGMLWHTLVHPVQNLASDPVVSRPMFAEDGPSRLKIGASGATLCEEPCDEASGSLLDHPRVLPQSN